MHGVQTGVAFEMERHSQDTTPKHLRTGLNSAMINDAAMARLLVKKGIFTEEEYAEEIRLEANRELERYEKRILENYGISVTLR
jgi:hypothetical protein